jgi:hypothetical protein
MSTKTLKKNMTFGVLVAAVLISVMSVTSSGAYAAVAAPSAGIVRPAFNEPALAPKVAPRPFTRPISDPFFFPRFNPFLFENPFFFQEPFFFNEEAGFAAD